MQRFIIVGAVSAAVLLSAALGGCSAGQTETRDPLAGAPLQRMHEAAVAEVSRREAEAQLNGHAPLTQEQRALAISAIEGELEAKARFEISREATAAAIRNAQPSKANQVPYVWKGAVDANRRARNDNDRSLRAK